MTTATATAPPTATARPASRGPLRILDARDVVHAAETEVGGKARSLATLLADGANVPGFFCVSTAVFADVARGLTAPIADLLAGVDYRDQRSVKAAAAAIEALFIAASLPAADTAAVKAAFDRAFGSGDETLVAVRSSAVGEDSAQDSFAGQLDTYLWVRRADVVDHVVRCLASAFGPRALLYRHLRGLSAEAGVEAAVIVQKMVDSRTAGVMFTANPTTGDTNDMVVSAGIGLGEGVVNGSVECDTFYVNGATLAVRLRDIGTKRSRVIFDRANGTGTVTGVVEPAIGDAPALTDAELHALTSAGRDIARRRGAPQDLEWAIDGSGTLFLLQARPITTLHAGRQTIFDNSNVVESYPGLSSPLTFSFVRLAYEVLFRASATMFGLTQKDLDRNHDIYPNLLALLDGRIYYNISNWYRLFLQLPGMERAIPAWEKALGIERRFAPPPSTATWWTTLRSIPTRIALVFRLLRNWWQLPGKVDLFRTSGRNIEIDAKSRDLDGMEPAALVDLVEGYSRDLRPKYSVTVMNDFVTQQLYEAMGRLISRWNLGEPATTRNELLCGERGMESVEPVRSMVRLTERARAMPELLAVLEGPLSAHDAWARISTEPAFAPFLEAAMVHVEHYGDRTLEELKLETHTLGNRPHQIVSMVRNYLRGGQNVEDMERHEQAIRAAAEARVGKKLRFRPLRRALFSFVLTTCRWGIKTRENLRLARSRSFGVVKRIYRALGRRFTERELIGGEDDIFFLTIEEAAATIRGNSVTRDLIGLIALRKAEYERYRPKTLSPRIVTHGIVYTNRFERELANNDGEKVLTGIACSPGKIKAPVKVVLTPSSDLRIDGEILVASATDPGWVFLMVASGGLISEKGSVLSHTAIIGRELGIPTVVGVRDATARLIDGEIVELNGDAGQVVRQS